MYPTTVVAAIRCEITIEPEEHGSGWYDDVYKIVYGSFTDVGIFYSTVRSKTRLL